MPTGTVRGAAMTMKTDTQEATFVGDVAVQSGADRAGSRRPASVATRASRSMSPPSSSTSTTPRAPRCSRAAWSPLQGDTTLKTPELRIAYEGKAADSADERADRCRQGRGEEAARACHAWWRATARSSPMGTDRRIAARSGRFRRQGRYGAVHAATCSSTSRRTCCTGRRLFVDRKNDKSRLEFAGRRRAAGRAASPPCSYQGERQGRSRPSRKSAAAGDGHRRGGNMLGTFKTDPNAPMDIEANTPRHPSMPPSRRCSAPTSRRSRATSSSAPWS